MAVALELGGRWRHEAATFVRFLARTRARELNNRADAIHLDPISDLNWVFLFVFQADLFASAGTRASLLQTSPVARSQFRAAAGGGWAPYPRARSSTQSNSTCCNAQSSPFRLGSARMRVTRPREGGHQCRIATQRAAVGTGSIKDNVAASSVDCG